MKDAKPTGPRIGADNPRQPVGADSHIDRPARQQRPAMAVPVIDMAGRIHHPRVAAGTDRDPDGTTRDGRPPGAGPMKDFEPARPRVGADHPHRPVGADSDIDRPARQQRPAMAVPVVDMAGRIHHPRVAAGTDRDPDGPTRHCCPPGTRPTKDAEAARPRISADNPGRPVGAHGHIRRSARAGGEARQGRVGVDEAVTRRSSNPHYRRAQHSDRDGDGHYGQLSSSVLHSHLAPPKR